MKPDHFKTYPIQFVNLPGKKNLKAPLYKP